jgi:hypothetical protein
MTKSVSVSIPFLAAIAAGCSADHAVGVHLNAAGQCVSNVTGTPVDRQACTGHGGYYGGAHYVYSGPGSGSASDPSSSTVRGVLGSSAEGHAGAGGEGAGE